VPRGDGENVWDAVERVPTVENADWRRFQIRSANCGVRSEKAGKTSNVQSRLAGPNIEWGRSREQPGRSEPPHVGSYIFNGTAVWRGGIGGGGDGGEGGAGDVVGGLGGVHGQAARAVQVEVTDKGELAGDFLGGKFALAGENGRGIGFEGDDEVRPGEQGQEGVEQPLRAGVFDGGGVELIIEKIAVGHDQIIAPEQRADAKERGEIRDEDVFDETERGEEGVERGFGQERLARGLAKIGEGKFEGVEDLGPPVVIAHAVETGVGGGEAGEVAGQGGLAGAIEADEDDGESAPAVAGRAGLPLLLKDGGDEFDDQGAQAAFAIGGRRAGFGHVAGADMGEAGAPAGIFEAKKGAGSVEQAGMGFDDAAEVGVVRKPVEPDEEAALEEGAQAAELEAQFPAQRDVSAGGEILYLDETFLLGEKKLQFVHQPAEIVVLPRRGDEEERNARRFAQTFPETPDVGAKVGGAGAQRRRAGGGLGDEGAPEPRAERRVEIGLQDARMQFGERGADAAEGVAVEAAEFLRIAATAVKSGELPAVAVAEVAAPGDLAEQDGRLMARVRHVKIVLLLPRLENNGGGQDGKNAPAQFSLEINADETAMRIPKNIRIVDVTRAMDETLAGGGGGGAQDGFETREVALLDDQINVRGGVREDVVVVAEHAITDAVRLERTKQAVQKFFA
jgi:hypothetical protein